MDIDTIAAKHNGTPIHCHHSDTDYCQRCRIPLHAWAARGIVIQFPNALSLVTFVREMGKVAADETRAKFLASA